MPQTNLIVNGTFDDGSANWSGSDHEAYMTEDAYLENGSNNQVAELDGNGGQTTVMEQTITVDDPLATELTFDVALRITSFEAGHGGTEGFDVEILDSSGTPLATGTILPTATSWGTVTIPVTFPTAGDYTIRFTEIGPDNGHGALIDNVSLLVCFHADTQISVPGGTCRAGDIRPGDLMVTEQGPKPVRWVGRRNVSACEMRADARLAPVRIASGALGRGLPKRTLRVSRQHRMVVQSKICARMFDTTSVLVPAIKLVGLPGIEVETVAQDVDYVHFLFDSHEIVLAEGAPAESLLLTDMVRGAIASEAQEELRLLFPEGVSITSAKTIPVGHAQKSLAARHLKNGMPLLSA